jgi:competence protein ComEA
VGPDKPGALSRVAARVMGSRFAKPVARAALVAMGLASLAAIGRAGSAGAFGGSPALPQLPPDAAAVVDPGVPAPTVVAAMPPTTASAPSHGATATASAENPVILNTAAADDLRRLPGIGQKRADAILALRARLGRFRAVEDLLKVKGIGRATLKRLRPLVRLDPPVVPDAGARTAPG